MKAATLTTFSAGLALGAAHSIFGQRGSNEDARPTRRDTRGDAGDYFQVPLKAQQDALSYFKASTFTPYVGDIFQVPNALGEMIELKLTGVSEYKMKAATRMSYGNQTNDRILLADVQLYGAAAPFYFYPPDQPPRAW